MKIKMMRGSYCFKECVKVANKANAVFDLKEKYIVSKNMSGSNVSDWCHLYLLNKGSCSKPTKSYDSCPSQAFSCGFLRRQKGF